MKIKIKEPCDADWSKMKIGIQSRHCELCVKNVMDFTQMTRQEIIEYLFKNQNQSTCGRMVGGQIDFKIADFEAVIEGNRKRQGNHPFLVLSFAALAMMSCGSESDTCNDPVIGKIIATEHSDTSSVVVEPKDSTKCATKISDPAFPQEIGEVAGGVEIETGGMTVIPNPLPTVDGMIEIIEPDVMGDLISPNEFMGDTTVISQADVVLDVAEKMPEFVGGMEKLMDYLESEISYPKKSQKKEIEGTVYIQFVVNEDGSISNTRLMKGIGKDCDKEALRVINSMPNWIPGENRGQKVRVKYILPIKFVLK